MPDVILQTCLYMLVTFSMVYLARIIYKVIKYRHMKKMAHIEEAQIRKQNEDRLRRSNPTSNKTELPTCTHGSHGVEGVITSNNDPDLDRKRLENVISIWGGKKKGPPNQSGGGLIATPFGLLPRASITPSVTSQAKNGNSNAVPSREKRGSGPESVPLVPSAAKQETSQKSTPSNSNSLSNQIRLTARRGSADCSITNTDTSKPKKKTSRSLSIQYDGSSQFGGAPSMWNAQHSNAQSQPQPPVNSQLAMPRDSRFMRRSQTESVRYGIAEDEELDAFEV